MKNGLLDLFGVLLALAPPPTQPGTQPDPRAQILTLVGTLLLMGVMFYFLLIRPQRVRAKQQEQMLKTLKPGDKVVTTSGLLGVVVSVKERTVFIRSADAKLEVLKSAVAEITERGRGNAS